MHRVVDAQAAGGVHSVANRYDRSWADYIRATVAELRQMVIRPGGLRPDVRCGTGVLLASVVAVAPGATLSRWIVCHEMLRVGNSLLVGIRWQRTRVVRFLGFFTPSSRTVPSILQCRSCLGVAGSHRARWS